MNHPRFLNNRAQKQNIHQPHFSLAFLHLMINSILDPIFVKDRQHHWVLINDSFCDFVGHSREELIGKSDYDFFPRTEADIIWEKDELIFTTKIFDENQHICTDAEGRTHLIYIKKSCFEDETSNKFLVGSIRDLILQNKANEAGNVSNITDTTKLTQTCEILWETVEELRQQNKELTIAYQTAESERRRYQDVADSYLVKDSQQQAKLGERQQIEQDLHRINAVLQAQQEASIDAILIIDENRQVASYNQKFCQLWQIPPQIIQTGDDHQLLGWVLDQLINPEEFLSKVEFLYQHPEESIRDEILLKCGKTFDRYCAPVCRYEAVEDYYTRILYFRDITEYKQAETELKASQQRLALLIEQTPLAIIEWNTNFEIQTWNRAAEKIFGYSPEEMLGNPFEIIIPENVRKHVNKIATALLTQKGGSFSVNENVTKDGKTMVCEWYNNPLVDADGQVIGVASMVLDITESRRAKQALLESEEQLRQQAEELQQALEELQRTQIQLIQSEKMSSLGQLVAGVAHEINNPVNFIYGNLNPANEYTQDLLSLLELYEKYYPQPVQEIQNFVEAIELDFLKLDLPQTLNSMNIGANRIREIVLSLRTFSRLDEAEMKAVDIHEGIDSTLMILQNRFKANDHRPIIEVIKEYGKLPLVECYAGQLNQVFINILTNAIDALEQRVENGEIIKNLPTPPMPCLPTLCPTLKIQIRTELLEQNQVTIVIADNGLGIQKDVQKQIFDPFFTTKPIGKGTGMGLAISYQIVTERHSGSLQCISQPGQGTEFIIKIPLNQGMSR
ncbi:PAS domain S-box protein [Nostoc sp. PA-18-2419]|uniref:PAS domain-containing sensor histidine kinase n=1 Tax=Nostoc sp. PA-18-2419 TaxID=2575443 RepID=UPI00110819ED|nr:PAS domain S-box protein [Nostoc sp. PA-18-2419]